MPTFLSTVKTSANPAIDISTQGIHQLALRRMSVNVLLGATKVSTTRSTSESGLLSSGTVEVAALMGSPFSRTEQPRRSRARRDCIITAFGCVPRSARELFHVEQQAVKRDLPSLTIT